MTHPYKSDSEKKDNNNMSSNVNKMSSSLKALLKSPSARGSPVPAPSSSSQLFDRISSSSSKVGPPTWLTLATAALVTLNSPATLCELYTYATRDLPESTRLKESVERAAIMREAGLKTISFSGIPRTINALGALRAHLPTEVAEALNTKPYREPTPKNVQEITGPRALALWNSVYDPHSAKLLKKLGDSHPDLPVHILCSHYGPLLSDPESMAVGTPGRVGRVLTSVAAVAALRAQGGVTPQVTSHVFGLKKSLEEGSDGIQGEEFLASDEGAIWVLDQVDDICSTVTGGAGSFALPRSKL